MSSTHDVTRLLVAWGEGNRAAESELIEILYVELKRLAKAYLKLVDQRNVHWRNRTHFFGIAAQAMRRILVDRARASLAAKRGGEAIQVPFVESQSVQESPDVDVLELDTALSRLESLEPRWSRLIELRFFAGLSVDETAAALELSPATVKRDWSLARAWLYRELRANGPAEAR